MPKLSHQGSHTDQLHPHVKMAMALIDRLDGIMKEFCIALLITGARPRELLDIRIRDVDPRGMVLIRARKRGNDRIVYCPSLLKLIPKSYENPELTLFRRFSYAKFYRHLRDLCRPQGALSSTHVPMARLFRRAYARANLALAAGDYQPVVQSLGHKRESSTHTYTEGR